MKIGFVTVAYALPDAITRLFECVRSDHHNVEHHLFLHSAKPDVVAACDRIARRDDVIYYPHQTNRGLARSWNDGIQAAYDNGADVVIVANDDIVCEPGDLDRLAEYAACYRVHHVVSGWGINERTSDDQSMAFGFFAVNPVFIQVLGAFDENFFPIYCEDADVRWRAKQIGLAHGFCKDTRCRHGGSTTIRSDNRLNLQNQMTSVLNWRYYVRKWGGPPGKEVLQHPFNNPNIGYYIDPANRHTPYGFQYDRTDQSIVVI